MALFLSWTKASVCVCVAAMLWSFLIKPRLRKSPQTLSPMNHFTIGVFLAGVILFVPVNALDVIWKNVDFSTLCGSIFYTFFWSLVNSLRLFVLGIDPDVIRNALPKTPQQTNTLISIYSAIIYFLAPALTFTTVLSFFSNFVSVLRLRLCRFRKIYIMSELNTQAMAMAGQIVERNRRKLIPPLLVFANTSEESGYDARLQARRLNGLCLKADASHLRMAKLGRSVEIFLLGNNETENVAHAIALAEQYQSCPRNICVYVYAPMDYADHILDGVYSVPEAQTCVGSDKLEELAKNDPLSVLLKKDWMKLCSPRLGHFSLRRIDPVDLLVKQVLTAKDYQDYCKIYDKAEKQHNKTISITVLGMGRYGNHFLKTAAWFYQKYGYRVEFNVIDVGAENGDIQKRFAAQCPELLSKANAAEEDEAQYDIRFFQGIDCLSADLETLIEINSRFDKTQLVFIALGEDELNIQTAINLRTMFDRIQIRKGTEAPESWPLIYAVIYDDQKVSNLNANRLDNGLVNHKDERYDIRFISALASQYSYEIISTLKEQELEAFHYHLDWSRKESQLRIFYELANGAIPLPEDSAIDPDQCQAFRQKLDREVRQNGKSGALQWYGADLIVFTEGKSFQINVDTLNQKAAEFIRHAYYRNSSAAKATHKRALAKLSPTLTDDHSPLCECDACAQQRITEHMRWNAYLRSQGFCVNSSSSKRYDRARMHHDLVPWHALPCREQYKD